MKRRVRIFLALVALGVLLLPVTNVARALWQGTASSLKPDALLSRDSVAATANRVLHAVGISGNPQEVVVGRDGWLYLGDRYEQTRSVTRRGATPADTHAAREIASAAVAWDVWLRARGVRLYRVMVAPNKETIYPEHLPAWARPAATTQLDALMAATRGGCYIDLRAALREARQAAPETPLYYRTDTHWNLLGAGVAFRAFARSVAPRAPELRWPGDDMIALLRVHRIPGGDLARMLRMSADLPDLQPVTRGSAAALETTQYRFASGEFMRRGRDTFLLTPTKPLRVVSADALNDRKVLWLRDSFGTALAPYMAATFTQVVQVHWQEALKSPQEFARLVERWHPDYVFVTVVERSVLAPEFTGAPPAADGE